MHGARGGYQDGRAEFCEEREHAATEGVEQHAKARCVISGDLRREVCERLAAVGWVLFFVMAFVAIAWTICLSAVVLAVGGTWSQAIGAGILAIAPTWICAARIGAAAGRAMVDTAVEVINKRNA